ncbi:LPXTG cell wall anchor domain-containing protein [Kroppenstedtia pulmonis]|uniref:LPXTG cell wall anchor domain-containing protein n=1 Tax=Kroppenstedtia pulmonis TaxID=1380685 RepID=A0A7D3XP68_9BACL|nr:LPXTG cell wall anchor domain-containing protein [Kroppenstedtia pulmonis]QKG83362.1 LPXTG cell wall anchor domain-containing protein [Kroppenstedtia pulmonis]
MGKRYYYDNAPLWFRLKEKAKKLREPKEPVPYYLNDGPIGEKIGKVGKKAVTVAAVATMSVSVLGPPVFALPTDSSTSMFSNPGNPGDPAMPSKPDDNPVKSEGPSTPGNSRDTGNPGQPDSPNDPGVNPGQLDKPEEKPVEKPDKSHPSDKPEETADAPRSSDNPGSTVKAKESPSEPAKSESPKPSVQTPATNQSKDISVAQEKPNEPISDEKPTNTMEKNRNVQLAKDTQKEAKNEAIRTEEGGELPETSTNSPLFTILSSMGVLAGTGLLFSRRKVGE